MTNAQELALGTDPFKWDSQILFTIEGKVQSGMGLTAGQNISISLKAKTTYLPNDYSIQTDGSYLYWESAQKGLFSNIGGSEIGSRDISTGGYSAIGFVDWAPRSPTSRFEVYLDGNGCSFNMTTVMGNLLNAPTSLNLSQFFGGKVGAYYPDQNNSSMEWHDSNSSFNATVEKITISAVVADLQAPVIILMGSNPLEVYKGSAFSDPGATVTDNVDVTRTITGSGAVNTASVGFYTLTYTAQDAAGNLGLPVTRTVNVVLDPAGDEDGDGLTNAQELALGSNPYQGDTDGDGFDDKAESLAGTDPNDAAAHPHPPGSAITSLRVRAHIDGPSQLILSPEGIRWYHWDWTAVPGRHEGRNDPTYLNDVTWYPDWPQFGENRNIQAYSSYNTDFNLAEFLNGSA
ncbi:MAG: DUF5011 domain-containing protein, partial [Actinobacteria bacterium]|nr:DUF5011 domain-containing protein [Actinomycetota bacterium]